MRRFFLAIGVFALAQSANAQTLRVQSGDHAGFTRLVIPIGADRSWNIVERNSRTWDIEIDPAVDGFDTGSAFDLIQRTRLASLDGDTNLTLLLSCDCPISSFRHQGQYLVVDISDPPELPDPQIPEAETADVARQEERTRAADALPNLASLLSGSNQLPILNTSPEAPALLEAAGAVEVTEDRPNPQLEEAAQIMAEQLARAAASGLLDAALDQPQTFADPIEASEPTVQEPDDIETPEAEPSAIAADQEIDQGTGPDNYPIRTQTALDPRIQLDRPLSPAMMEESCSADAFDARDWAEATSFEQGLGELRLGLYDDRDTLVEEGVEALALYYLYYGFGAEAHHWLMQLEEPSDDLLHIAALVDGSEETSFPEVDSPADCSDGELLWRYIDGAVAVDLTSEDLAAIQRAYAQLPVHLRDLLGPRLARALHRDRHGPAARNVRDILHRGGRVPVGELRILDLDLGISVPESVNGTRDALAEMLMGNASDAIATMAQALAFDRSVGVRPPPERLTAAEALLRENGSGPETNVLWREVLLGHAALGSIDTALAMLSNSNRDDEVFEDALTALIADRVTVEDTATLLVLAHSFGARWRPEGSDAGRAQIAAIALLREEGLYEAAQILRDVRRPLILPARNDDGAIETDPVQEAWDSGNWEDLSEIASGAHNAIAARMVAQANPAEQTDGALEPLDAVVATLADSQTLREVVGALLARPRPE